MITTSSSRIRALLNLLADDDRQVSSVAMEQLLQLDADADPLVAEFQESHNPVLRGRIHQMGNILTLRRTRALFIEGVRTNSLSLWDGILQINYLYNPQMSPRQVNERLGELVGKLPRTLTTVRLAEFMRQESFSYAREDFLGADLYLLDDVLVQQVGSPILLSCLAQHLGQQRAWHSTIVLHKGKHCLYDANGHLVEPAEGWRVARLTRSHKLHPCAARDVWLTILGQLYLAAILEGRLQAIHRVGSILATLCGGDFAKLPYPLGN